MLIDLNDLQKNDTKTVPFIAKDFFQDLNDDFEKCLNEILEKCNFDGYSSARFDVKSFDTIINNRKKETEGKGFKAYINTIVALCLMKYLNTYGKFSPRLLLIDSPILTLKEPQENQASSPMKEGLFWFLLDNQQMGQMIIIENELPKNVDSTKANIIEFTRDVNRGRYGFLRGYRD